MKKVILEITHYCNFNCNFCYVMQQKDYYFKNEFNFDIIDFLRKIKPTSVLITGGEPLLSPNFEEIYLEVYKITKRIGISTNGSFIKNKFKFLKSYPPDFILLSVHPFGKNDYPNFQISNLELARKLSNKVIASFVFLKEWKNEFYKLIGNENFDNVILRIIYPILPNQKENWNFLEFLFELKNIVDFIKKSNKNIKLQLSHMLSYFFTKKGSCDALKGTIVIDPIGNIYLCTFIKNITKIGSIYDDLEELKNRRKHLIEKFWKNKDDKCLTFTNFYGSRKKYIEEFLKHVNS